MVCTDIAELGNYQADKYHSVYMNSNQLDLVVYQTSNFSFEDKPPEYSRLMNKKKQVSTIRKPLVVEPYMELSC